MTGKWKIVKKKSKENSGNQRKEKKQQIHHFPLIFFKQFYKIWNTKV